MKFKLQYYHQWQHLPVNTDKWQAKPLGKVWHPAVSKIVEKTEESVLNVGCGAALDHGLFNCSYIGVDVTPKFTRAAHLRGADVICASGLALPFKDDSFGTVYCKDVIVHLPPGDWRPMLGEMWRVAARRVVTVEGEWGDISIYLQWERYMVNEGQLMFWNNIYGREEVLGYAASRGVPEPRVVSRDGWQASWYEMGEES